MPSSGFQSGLTLRVPSPPAASSRPDEVITAEAGIRAASGDVLRVTPLVAEDELVAQGASLACLRDAPEVRLVAPMSARVARISLLPGRRLGEIVLFSETGGDVVRHPRAEAGSEPGLRSLMQRAGLWPSLRRRPFGGMPEAAERPVAIVVMALDTRPLAPDPRRALEQREEAFARGLDALAMLDRRIRLRSLGAASRCSSWNWAAPRSVDCGARHPQGSSGIRVHDLAPATLEAPVWDVHAEDVAALGELLDSGIATMTRLVSVAGPALREAGLVRTQAGADLRGLAHRALRPGPHVLLSGSSLDGHEAHWLGPRDRQVSARCPAPRGPARLTGCRRAHLLGPAAAGHPVGGAASGLGAVPPATPSCAR